MKESDVAFCVCHLEDAMTNTMVPERKAMSNKEPKIKNKKDPPEKVVGLCLLLSRHNLSQS